MSGWFFSLCGLYSWQILMRSSPKRPLLILSMSRIPQGSRARPFRWRLPEWADPARAHRSGGAASIPDGRSRAVLSTRSCRGPVGALRSTTVSTTDCKPGLSTTRMLKKSAHSSHSFCSQKPNRAPPCLSAPAPTGSDRQQGSRLILLRRASTCPSCARPCTGV